MLRHRLPTLDTLDLKVLALLCMTIDHLGLNALVPDPWIATCRTIGRIAAPLFLFLVTEGMRHTRSKGRYLLRLYVAGVAIDLCAQVLLQQGLIWSTEVNILPTFFYTSVCILALVEFGRLWRDMQRGAALLLAGGLWLGLSAATLWGDWVIGTASPFRFLLLAFLPSPSLVLYSFSFVLLGVLWYFLPQREIQCKLLFLFSLLTLIPLPIQSLAALLGHLFPFFSVDLFQPFQLPMLLAIPFLWLYNGEKGACSLKWFFYLYYPLHQFLFLYLHIKLQ